MITFMIKKLLGLLFRGRVKTTTQKEREEVASRSREWRSLVVQLVVFTALWIPQVIIALVHVLAGGWMPLELS